MTKKLASGFSAPNAKTVLVISDTKEVWAYVDRFRGIEYLNVRTVYADDGVWKPGKGLAIPAEHKAAFLKGLQGI